MIVEDGTGLADAQSFVSVVDAQSLFAVNPLRWESIKDLVGADLENALTRAFSFMATRYEANVSGTRLRIEQAGLFPRCGALRVRDAIMIGSSEIPREVITAQLDAANAFAAGRPSAGYSPGGMFGIASIQFSAAEDSGLRVQRSESGERTATMDPAPLATAELSVFFNPLLGAWGVA